MSRVSVYPSRPPSRPDSEQLCDLHVYKVPTDLWRAPLNNILNQSVSDTISLGIIRVPPDIPLVDIRGEILRQLEEQAPRDYVFLRSVGRSITRLKTKQEYILKAKHFLPPVHYAPELFLLEATPEIRDALAISDRSSQQSASSLQQGSPGGRSYRNGYGGGRNGYPGDRNSRQRQDSSLHQYSPLPRINPSSRDGSPSVAFLTDPYPPDNQPPLSDSQDSSYKDRGRAGYRGEQVEGGYPPHSVKSYEEAQQSSPTLRDNKRDGNQSRHPASDAQHDRARAFDHVPPPLDRRSPRRSPDSSPYRRGAATHRAANGYERDAAYTNHTNEDSGVAGMSPDDQYRNRDKENYYDALNSKTRDLQNRLNRDQFNLDDDDDEQRRLRDLEDGALMDGNRWAKDQDNRRRRAEEDRHRSEEERRRREEAERKEKEEEEERKRREQEKEEERRRQEEEARMKAPVSDEELNRFPSPPALRMSSPEEEVQRDTLSAKQRRITEKGELMQQLEEAREIRQLSEKEREELVKKAKFLQSKTQNRRNQARDVWKKRYFDEKKKTAPLEEQTNRLKEELEALHRKLMAVLEGPKDRNVKLGDSRPSQKNNYVIQCTRLQHDIDDIKRRVENAKMKLTAEMKLRNQAEVELRSLRAELVQKKINMSLVRSQQFAALSPGMKELEPAPVPTIPQGKGEEAQSVAA